MEGTRQPAMGGMYVGDEMGAEIGSMIVLDAVGYIFFVDGEKRVIADRAYFVKLKTLN